MVLAEDFVELCKEDEADDPQGGKRFINVDIDLEVGQQQPWHSAVDNPVPTHVPSSWP